MPLDDATLFDRWTTRGDSETFNEIVTRFADQVYATCRRILRNDADAEEICQECFLLLARSGNDVRTSLGGWLHRVATTKSLDRVRRDSSRRTREHSYAESIPETNESSWDDIQEHVDGAIETLPPELRDVVVAHFIGRKTHAEIAAELRLSRRAVTYRIQRGLDALRRELQRRGVTVTVLALAPLLAADAHAAPLSLKASLGKFAIATGTNAQFGTNGFIGSLFIMKAKISVAVVVLCAIAAATYMLTSKKENTPGPISAPPLADASPTENDPRATGPTTTPTSPVTVAAEDEKVARPTLEDLLALSRAELMKPLQDYPPIADPQQYVSISGVVVDQNGYPIPAAAILGTPSSGWGKLPGVGALSYASRSGADGAYKIEGIQRGGRYWITASKPGYADGARGDSSNSPIDIVAGNDISGIDFRLASGTTLTGRVLTASGNPVPDGVVQCNSLMSPTSMSIIQRYSARTDAQGFFTLGFEASATGNVTSVSVISALHGSSSFPDIVIQDDHAIELRLAAPSVIQGVVRNDNGKPEPAARLTFYGSKQVTVARPDTGDSWTRPSITGYYNAVCDNGGNYAVEVDAGVNYEAEVLVQRPDQAHVQWMNATRKLEMIDELKPGETREYSPIVNADAVTIRGKIVGLPSGRPFDTYIILVDIFAMRDGKRVGNGIMNGGGGYELHMPSEPGEYTVQARYSMFSDVVGEVSKPIQLSAGEEAEMDITLPEPQYFAVRAVAADGNPLSDVAVNFLTPENGTFTTNYRTNAEGRLEQITPMPPDSGVRMYLEKPGYATTWGPQYEDQHSGTIHPEEVIVMLPGAGFEGDLVDANGKPVTSAPLSITITNRDGQSWPISVSTDATGHFTIVDQAPADVVEITIAKSEGGQTWPTKQQTLEAGAIANLGVITVAE